MSGGPSWSPAPRPGSAARPPRGWPRTAAGYGHEAAGPPRPTDCIPVRPPRGRRAQSGAAEAGRRRSARRRRPPAGAVLCHGSTTAGSTRSTTRWEWEPSLIGFRAELERAILGRLIAELGPPRPVRPGEVPRPIFAAVDADEGPPLSRYLETPGDPRAVPRVRRPSLGLPAEGGRSAHLCDPADRRAGEGGDGRDPGRRVRRRRCERMHSRLFAETMLALGLDSTYGAYVGRLPGDDPGDGQPDLAVRAAPALARRARRPPRGLRDQLAASPNRRYANGLRRLGFGAARHRVLRRARRGRLGAREHRRLRPRRRARPPGARARRPDPLRRPGAAALRGAVRGPDARALQAGRARCSNQLAPRAG